MIPLMRELQAQVTPVTEATTEIIVTTRDLAIGTVINQEDVQTASVPVSLVPRDALLTVDAALGKMVTVHLVQGEMVLQHHLADPLAFLAFGAGFGVSVGSFGVSAESFGVSLTSFGDTAGLRSSSPFSTLRGEQVLISRA